MGELICADCGAPAAFLTPFGLKCGPHALHNEGGEDRDWLPLPIKARYPEETVVEIHLEDTEETVEA